MENTENEQAPLTKEEKMKLFIESRKNGNVNNQNIKPPKNSKGKTNTTKRFITNGGGFFDK